MYPEGSYAQQPANLPRHGDLGANRSIGNSSYPPPVRTPVSIDSNACSKLAGTAITCTENSSEDGCRFELFRSHFERTEARLVPLLRGTRFGSRKGTGEKAWHQKTNREESGAQESRAPKRPARMIDEDNYGDDDEKDEEDEPATAPISNSSTARLNSLRDVGSSFMPQSQGRPTSTSNFSLEQSAASSSADPQKSPESIRKKLEQDKKAFESLARWNCYNLYHTMETDRGAMLEQQKLDELDRQIEKELSSQGSCGPDRSAIARGQKQGFLSHSNLGASSLILKHLIARIDAKRDMVHANDAQLRNLISEVKKNRSKWASEDRIGQVELYEAAERVLIELKAHTEHAAPFLQRVNKREAPDYYTIIKHPMDIGTMMKKMKALQYKSKQEFLNDLYLIWSNCFKYNQDPNHFLRKKAMFMKKQTDKLVRLIPDVTVRLRSELEAEERRQQNGALFMEGAEDSEDEEPIMASRGRKAFSKGKKGTSLSRTTATTNKDVSSGAETKPNSTGQITSFNAGVDDSPRASSDTPLEGLQNGFSTPPQETPTNLAPSNDTEPDSMNATIDDPASGNIDESDLHDLEYTTWKQMTKKARAQAAARRHRAFRGTALNPDEPATTRTRMGMRRWLRGRELASRSYKALKGQASEDLREISSDHVGESLAEEIEQEEDQLLPDYYDVVSMIPEIDENLLWKVDALGQVVDQNEETLRLIPPGHFTAPQSQLTRKIDEHIRQIQQNRKICSKIAIVRQMQMQTQSYQTHFQKYDPKPFLEADIEPRVVTDDGPVMCNWTCRAALQRSIGKLLYHAGFEQSQPSALDALTDIAGQFFQNVAKTLKVYLETPKIRADSSKPKWRPRFTEEEAILHTLCENGTDVPSLESYIKEDLDRLGMKLNVMRDRMKSHYSELLRPAVDMTHGPPGAAAFQDGSDQFIGGDFAEDIGEDFFGFKELGLDQEFGIPCFSVPLHLLRNRLGSANPNSGSTSSVPSGLVIEQLPAYEPVTTSSVNRQIGLVQKFFLSRLQEYGRNRDGNGELTLIEDDDLPAKQRFPKPRLPPTGKITSPRKRPIREQQQLAKKKKKIDEGKDYTLRGGAVSSITGYPGSVPTTTTTNTGAGEESKIRTVENSSNPVAAQSGSSRGEGSLNPNQNQNLNGRSSSADGTSKSNGTAGVRNEVKQSSTSIRHLNPTGGDKVRSLSPTSPKVRDYDDDDDEDDDDEDDDDNDDDDDDDDDDNTRVGSSNNHSSNYATNNTNSTTTTASSVKHNG